MVCSRFNRAFALANSGAARGKEDAHILWEWSLPV